MTSIDAYCAPVRPADIDLHARNFRYDRFSLDPRLPEQGRVALYRAWITNSLVRYEAAWAGRDFCTFKEDGRELVIDLVSVLVAGQGIGGRLVRAVRSAAGLRGLEGVRVVTEVENRSAWRLYSREGFAVDGYVHVFHLVRS